MCEKQLLSNFTYRGKTPSKQLEKAEDWHSLVALLSPHMFSPMTSRNRAGGPLLYLSYQLLPKLPSYMAKHWSQTTNTLWEVRSSPEDTSQLWLVWSLVSPNPEPPDSVALSEGSPRSLFPFHSCTWEWIIIRIKLNWLILGLEFGLWDIVFVGDASVLPWLSPCLRDTVCQHLTLPVLPFSRKRWWPSKALLAGGV